MKKLLSLFLVVCMLFTLTGCGEAIGGMFFLALIAAGDDRADKDDIIDFVLDNEEDLRKAIEAGDFSAYENQGFIKEIDTEETVVDFSCGGFGVGSGTSYVGFFYTPDNDMTAAWCAPASAEDLTPSGDGFRYQEENGDNQYYTEKICENFYY